MALADLNVRLGLLTENFEKSLKNVDRSLRRFQRNIEGIGQDLTQSITLPLAGIGAAAVKSFADLEASTNALAVTSNDAKTGVRDLETQIAALREVAKLPGLGFEEAVAGSARLQAVGLSSKEAEESLVAFGNAVARSGGGRVELEGALLALTQIASKGKISAEEINQLNERIFEIRPALEAAFGTSNSEELQKLGVSSEEFIAKVTAELGKLDRVQGGLANSFENLGDSVRTNLARVGDIINNTFDIGGLIERFDAALTSVVDTFSNLDAGTQKTIVRVAAFAAGIGPALLGLGKIVALGRTAISSLQLLNDGFKAVAGGAINAANNIKKLNFAAVLTPQVVALTAAIGGAVLIWREFNRRVELANAAQNAVKDVTTQAAQALAVEEVKVGRLIDTLKDENATREEKQRALSALQEQSPQYFGTLDLEKSKIEDITKAYENYRQSVLLQAQAQAATNKLTEAATRRIEKLQEAEDLRASLAEQTGGKLQAAFSIATGWITRTAAQLRRVEEELESIDKENAALIRTLKDAEDGLNSLGGNTGTTQLANTVTQDFERTDAAAKKFSDTIKGINDDIAAIDQRGIAFGIDVDASKIEALGAGIEKLFDLGANADNSAVQGFVNQIDQLRGTVDGLQSIGTLNLIPDEVVSNTNTNVEAVKTTIDALALETFAGITGVQSAVEGVAFTTQALGLNVKTAFEQYGTGVSLTAEAMATLLSNTQQLGLLLNENNRAVIDFGSIGGAAIQTFGSGLEAAIAGTKTFGKAVLQTISEVIKVLVQQGIAAIIANTLQTTGKVLGPLAIPIAAAAGAAASALFNKVVGLAEGGIVPPGFPNDTFPARLSSGEAVIPLDRINSVLGDRVQQVFIPNLTIRGQDFVIAFEKARSTYNRIS